ncbi:MAG: DnaJ domain-containing protein [Planctomycetia bacterium]|nr:MAG: DnaJ domain-containing protein [Planctomycetia bacterium]
MSDERHRDDFDAGSAAGAAPGERPPASPSARAASATPRAREEAAFRRFVQRVWQHDVAPLLRDRQAAQRRGGARIGGSVGAGAGLLLDRLFGLRGRPFARFGTVVGATLGAVLPDAWDWQWFRSAGQDEQRAVSDAVQRRAADLPEVEALELLGLTASATRDDLRIAWRRAAAEWHPDGAANDADRTERHLRFVALQAAHERLRAAYDAGRLPLSGDRGPSR